MKVLVTGANGLVGSNVVSAVLDRGWSAIGTYHTHPPDDPIPHEKFDLRTPDRIDSLLARFSPDAVVNCAAMTDVDGCETAPSEASRVNGRAPGVIAERCADRSVELIHLSTDYVFDGRARMPYAEDDAPNPVQAYGRSKLEGERAVLSVEGTSVVRLAFVYGVHGSSGALDGFPAWVRDRLATDDIPLFTDQYCTPTRAGRAATDILQVLQADVSGLFHAACRSCVTPYQFGTKLCELLGEPPSRLERTSRFSLDRPARRPEYSCLDVSRLERVLDRPQPTLREDLEAITDHLGYG